MTKNFDSLNRRVIKKLSYIINHIIVTKYIQKYNLQFI